MKALTRLVQTIAIIGAIASGLFFFLSRQTSNQSKTELGLTRNLLSTERQKVAALNARLLEQAQELEQSTVDANASKSEIASLTARFNQLQRENLRLNEELAARQLTEERLQQENARLTRELAENQATSVPKDQIDNYEAQIADLERKILELEQTQATRLQPQRDKLNEVSPINPMLQGSVLTVGKANSFVIINLGYSDGVRLQTELLIQHADTPIAKIQVTEVKENLSIARILPQSLVKTPQTGDSVTSLN